LFGRFVNRFKRGLDPRWCASAVRISALESWQLRMGVEVAMSRRLRVRFWVETIAGAVTGALFFVTLIGPDWLEAFGWDPDQHSGAVEWLIVAGLVVATLALFSAARREWLHAPTAAVQRSAR
jgi:hypothetical protein